MRIDPHDCDVFTQPANDGSVRGPMAWTEILVVRLQEPLKDYPESSRDDPERAELSVVRAVFGCDRDRRVVEKLCRESCDEMVATQKDLLPSAGRSRHNVRFQYKVTCEALQRLVDAGFKVAELEASASPSTKLVVGQEPVQRTSSDDVVKARCSCVDGSKFQSGFQRIAGAWIMGRSHPMPGACRKGESTQSPRLTSSWAKWMMKTRHASVLRIAARLAAWSNYAETDDDQVEGDYVEWDSTDKHRVMFVIKKSKLKELGHGPAQARRELWCHGQDVAPKLDVSAKRLSRSLALTAQILRVRDSDIGEEVLDTY